MSTENATLTLFDIGVEMEQLKNYIEGLGGDVTDPDVEIAIDAWLADNETRLEEKLEGYGWLIRQEAGIGAVRKAEADRMADLAKVNMNLADRLKRRLTEFFKAHALKTVQTTSFKFNLQGSGGKRPLRMAESVQDNIKLLPRKYLKTVTVVDTDKLRADLEEMSAKIPTGPATTKDLAGLAWLEPLGQHLVIK
jgi:hypothetical protein